MFKIGDFSKICRVPVLALRYYADIGLLEAAHVDAESGYRYYTLDQLPRLNRILALKDLGLSLEKITRLLNDPLSPAEVKGMLRLREAELEQELEAAQARLERIRARVRQIEQEDAMPQQEVILKSVEPMPILSIREVAPQPAYVETLFRESAPHLQNVQLIGPPFTIFHDDEFKDADMDVEIAFPVQVESGFSIALADDRQLVIRHLDGLASAVSIIHVGSYDAFPETYALIGQWIDANRFHIAGPAREIYLRPHTDGEDGLTEIQFPVSKGA